MLDRTMVGPKSDEIEHEWVARKYTIECDSLICIFESLGRGTQKTYLAQNKSCQSHPCVLNKLFEQSRRPQDKFFPLLSPGNANLFFFKCENMLQIFFVLQFLLEK